MARHLNNLLARLRALPPLYVDAALGAVMFLQGAVLAILAEGDAVDKVVIVALVAAIGVALALRRRYPLTCMVVALAAMDVISWMPQQLADATSGCFLAVVFLVYSMAYRTEGRRLLFGVVAGLVAAWTSVLVDSYDDDFGEVIIAPVIIIAAPALVGQMLRSRASLTAALRDKGHHVQRERELRAEEAVAGERSRIAGELHDVVAHALGAMTVQASAARRLVRTDPARAGDAFAAVETTGREALTELRALLGVLRREDEELALAPQPRLANLADLVRRTRALGLAVDLDVAGEAPADLPAGVDLTAYRVVQEALAEALASGAAGAAAVNVRYGDGGLEVEVADDGTSGEPRHLLGMHERVRVYGGSLQAGPDRARGGHRVRARLPLEVPA